MFPSTPLLIRGNRLRAASSYHLRPLTHASRHCHFLATAWHYAPHRRRLTAALRPRDPLRGPAGVLLPGTLRRWQSVQPQPTLPALDDQILDTLRQLQRCQDALGADSHYQWQVSRLSDRICPNFNIGVVGINGCDGRQLIRALLGNPLGSEAFTQAIAQSVTSLPAEKPCVYRFGKAPAVLTKDDENECVLPLDWLQERNMALVHVPVQALETASHLHVLQALDVIILVNKYTSTQIPSAERRALQDLLQVIPRAIWVQELPVTTLPTQSHESSTVGVSGMSHTMAELVTVQGKSLAQSLFPGAPSLWSAFPVATAMATNAQALLQESPSLSPRYEQLWSHSGVVPLKSLLQTQFDYTAQHGIRNQTAQLVIAAVLRDLRHTLARTNQQFQTLANELMTLRARLTTACEQEWTQGLANDVAWIDRDIQHTQQQVRNAFGHFNFYHLLWDATRVTQALVDALQNNYFTGIETRLVFSAGKLNAQLTTALQTINGQLEASQALFAQWVQWQPDTNTADASAELSRGLAAIRDWNQPNRDLVDPTCLTQIVWQFQGQAVRLALVDRVARRIETTSIQGIAVQASGIIAAVTAYFFQVPLEYALGLGGLSGLLGLFWVKLRWNQLERALLEDPQKKALALRDAVQIKFQRRVRDEIVQPIETTLDDLHRQTTKMAQHTLSMEQVLRKIERLHFERDGLH
ncbi:hypothetical protein H4R34_000667 [Dimargaris verticillata]|uniref:Uncharacterized protein n=1 Tax=Dimargaris verticillata TaxID=2761393 RepID=A0A9W8EFP8_9FUNG|nr:hypothetical protein H4R34_000667 [Dimargaris verticillata]